MNWNLIELSERKEILRKVLQNKYSGKVLEMMIDSNYQTQWGFLSHEIRSRLLNYLKR